MNEGVALSQLADILPPPAPSGPDWILLLVVAVVCLIAVAALLWFVKKHYLRSSGSPAREALRRLAALRAAWQARTISDREAAYRLAALLRLGLALPQLAPQLRPAAVDNEQWWHETLAQLNALRYRDHAPSTLPSHCFDRAERWLAAAQREAR
jgi:hypothetical protein